MIRKFRRSKKNEIIAKNVEELLAKYPNNVKLNVGCGRDYKDGWINIDNNSDQNIENLDLNWDLRNPLPFKDSSVDYIFNEHFIEHLTVEESQSVIKDFMRVLKPGGVVRIAMPDLRVTVHKYLNVSLDEDPVIKKFGMDFIKTRAERMNINFRYWGHKWLYDWDELERRLKEVGCKNIQERKRGDSKFKELKNLETREESNLIVEVIK